MWVAVGFSVVWESEQTYYLDDVAVELLQIDTHTTVPAEGWGVVKRDALW